MGYPSRSSFFTAAAYAALGEENTDAGADADANADANANAETACGSLPESVTAWLAKNTPALSEEEIQGEVHGRNRCHAHAGRRPPGCRTRR